MRLRANAKVNLTLDVLFKREDNYHEVEMIMQTIDLCDYIEIEESHNIEIICSHPFVPTDNSNLVYKAVEVIQKFTGIKKGVKITIEKNIPVAAGLGGGSSDCAATLKGLNKLWNLDLTNETLKMLGLKLGADVPFFIDGGTQLARGIGEKLEPLPSPPQLWMVLAKPNIGVSTRDVYGGLEFKEVYNRPDTTAMIKALEEGNTKEICSNLANVLETVTLKKYSTVKFLKNKMAQMGATGVLMSGSGPTVYGICSGYDKAVKIAKGLETLAGEVFVTKFTETEWNI